MSNSINTDIQDMTMDAYLELEEQLHQAALNWAWALNSPDVPMEERVECGAMLSEAAVAFANAQIDLQASWNITSDTFTEE